MTKLSKVILHQALHGYKGGHKLLACSGELSDSEKRTMLSYSDYSGSGIEKNFTSYLTGYPLPSSKFYVFAKTWYADEMNRPGCVWTHSLLINFTDLWTLKNMQSLCAFFKRPLMDSSYDEYEEDISIVEKDKFPSPTSEKGFFNLSCELYSKPQKGIVLLGESSSQYEEKILQIWNWQWPKMKRNFTFCTGALSLRKYDEQPFDIQVMPYKRERAISSTETVLYELVDLNISFCQSEWLIKYEGNDLEELQTYMVKYGADVPGSRASFVPLLKSADLFKVAKSGSLEKIKFFFKNYFSDPLQAKILKEAILDICFEQLAVKKYELFQLLHSERTFQDIKWDYAKLLLLLWKKQDITSEELSSCIRDLFNEGMTTEAIEVLKEIKREDWIGGLFTSEIYLELSKAFSELDSEKQIWSLEAEIQQGWFEAFLTNPSTNWEHVITAMLDVGSDKFLDAVNFRMGAKVILCLLEWMNKSDKKLPGRWKLMIQDNKEEFFEQLCSLSKINKSILTLVIEIFDSKEVFFRRVTLDQLSKFIAVTKKSKIEPETTGIFTLLITSCYEDYLSNPEKVNGLLFQPLHDRLGDSIVHTETWSQFKWSMGRDLYGLIEQDIFSKLFNDRNRIPDWDHCEFLRRALIAIILKRDWNPLALVEAVKDQEAFEKIVDFAMYIKEGNKMLKAILKKLADADEKSTFHYKVLKNRYK